MRGYANFVHTNIHKLHKRAHESTGQQHPLQRAGATAAAAARIILYYYYYYNSRARPIHTALCAPSYIYMHTYTHIGTCTTHDIFIIITHTRRNGNKLPYTRSRVCVFILFYFFQHAVSGYETDCARWS